MKFLLVFFSLYLTSTGGTPPALRDIADEVQELIDTLKSISTAAALDGTNNVHSYIDDSLLRKNNTYAEMEATLAAQWLEHWLSVLKLYEASVGYDVSNCFKTNEDQLLGLPARSRSQATVCLSQYIKSLEGLRTDNVEKISAITQIVDALAEQVEECAGNLLCLSPLIEEIELKQVEIPQRIGIEVQNTADSVSAIDPKISTCTNNAISYMKLMGQSNVHAIELCVNNVIGGESK